MREEGDPMVVADYMYLAGREGSAVLVVRETKSGATLATVAPKKGGTVVWLVA